MVSIDRQQGILHMEGMSVEQVVRTFGSPTYIYSQQAIEQAWSHFVKPLQGRKHLVCYAVKTNSNLAILHLFAQLGAGFDIVSLGELERVLKAGGDPKKVVFSGVAKSRAEITRALEVGIRCFNVESIPELYRLNEIAEQMNVKAPISLRVNPDVDANTHPYISTGLKENKFGISHNIALEVYQQASQLPYLDIQGIDCHIGSQLTTLKPFLDAFDRVLQLLSDLKQAGITLRHIDVGGGLGVRYRDETPPQIEQYVQALIEKLEQSDDFRHVELVFEPGRALVANSGLLVTEVEYIKHHESLNFAIVNAGMNDLIRPALYESWMNIEAVRLHDNEHPRIYNIVGPICETGDFLGKERELAIRQGDLLAVFGAGAYGFSMSSNYNSRPRAAEVLIKQGKMVLIRAREQLSDLWVGENIPQD